MASAAHLKKLQNRLHLPDPITLSEYFTG